MEKQHFVKYTDVVHKDCIVTRNNENKFVLSIHPFIVNHFNFSIPVSSQKTFEANVAGESFTCPVRRRRMYLYLSVSFKVAYVPLSDETSKYLILH